MLLLIRAESMELFQCLLVISPHSGCYFPLDGSLMTGLIKMNSERREIKTGCTLKAAAADYTYITYIVPKNGELSCTLYESELILASVCLCLSPLRLSPSGSVSLSVFLVSVASVVCAVWLVALCGVCTWCQRKMVS